PERLGHGMSKPLPYGFRRLQALATLAIVGALYGCATGLNVAQSSVSIWRTSCYGSCPVYRFAVYSDGRYVWEGRAHVRVIGTVRGRFGASTYAAAMRLLREARYQEFTGSLERKIVSTDNPTVAIVVADASSQQTITDYVGCSGFPREEDL